MGDSFPATLPDRHVVARAGRAIDRAIDGALRPLGRAPDEGEIAALELVSVPAMAGDLRGERAMRTLSFFATTIQPGRVLVEPVHDTPAGARRRPPERLAPQ